MASTLKPQTEDLEGKTDGNGAGITKLVPLQAKRLE